MGACFGGLASFTIFRKHVEAVIAKERAEGGRLTWVPADKASSLIEVTADATEGFALCPTFPAGSLVILHPSGTVPGSTGRASTVIFGSPLLSQAQVVTEGRRLQGAHVVDEFRIDVSCLYFNELMALITLVSQGCPPFLDCIVTDPHYLRAKLYRAPPLPDELLSGNFNDENLHGPDVVLARRPGLSQEAMCLRPPAPILIQTALEELFLVVLPARVNTLFPAATATALNLRQFYADCFADDTGSAIRRQAAIFTGQLLVRPAADANPLFVSTTWHTFDQACRDGQNIFFNGIQKSLYQSPNQNLYPDDSIPAREQFIPYSSEVSARAEIDFARRILPVLHSVAYAIDAHSEALTWVTRRHEDWHGETFDGVSSFASRRIYSQFRDSDGALVPSQLERAFEFLGEPLDDALLPLIGTPPAVRPSLNTERAARKRRAAIQRAHQGATADAALRAASAAEQRDPAGDFIITQTIAALQELTASAADRSRPSTADLGDAPQ